MSSAAQEAAAALVPGMVSDLVAAMPLASDDDQLAADLAARSAAAAPETVPSSQPQTAPEAAAPAPVAAPEPVVEEEFDLEPVISDELQQLLDEPDFDEDARAEVQAQIDDGELDYTTDPEAATRLRKLEAENAWLKQQRVISDKKKWVAENLKAYPLVARYAPEFITEIEATSRRAFARQAKQVYERLSKVATPLLRDLEETKKGLRTEIVKEVRDDYRDNGWGTITAGPGQVPVEAG